MPIKKIKLFFRPVLLKDCRSLWYWRNHQEARRWSFNSKKIPYLTHGEWFKQAIHDPKKKIYVACNELGERIGQARFEQINHKTIISVTLNPRYYNKGIGNQIIRRASDKYLKAFPKSPKITAEIDQRHIASYKAFYKAGYILAKKRVKLGKKIFLLEYKQGTK